MKNNYFFLRTNFNFCPRNFLRIPKFLFVLFLLAVQGLFRSGAYSQDISLDNTTNQTILSAIYVQNNAAADQQQLKISGTVVNELGDPLAGATIQIEGTMTGAISDAGGKYSVDVPNLNPVLVVSFVGYVTQRIPADGRTTINISLVPTEEMLQEVVVIGYGTQKRTTITGAVSVIKGDEVAKVPVSNISNAISGKLAGVLTRANGGQPGEDNADIYIRGVATTGTATPLVVVDGIIRNNINQVDPSIIESVSILKDASATAPYGLAGANGVILITTKKGAVGLPTLSFNTYYG